MPRLNDSDIAWLREWVQPRHLDDNALAATRSAFERNPLRLLVMRDFFVERRARELARFMASEAGFEIHHVASVDEPDVASPGTHDGVRTVRVGAEEWASIPIERRFLRFGIGPGMSGDTLGWREYLQFRDALRDERFRAFIECNTGCALGPLMGLSAHAMSSGDLLAPHSDVNPWRQLAFNVYLSPSWSEDWGGDLVVTDRLGAVTRISPAFNSVVLFDVRAHRSHCVAPIDTGADRASRLSLAGWFLRPISRHGTNAAGDTLRPD